MGCLNSTSSNGTSPDPHPYVVQFSLTILVVIFILMTVFGNVMVVMAVTTSRALRAPQNLFLVSLACADILLATLVVPFSLAKELMGCWYFGHVWCEIYLALDVLFCTSSIIHLCAISLDRYWSISQAIEYNLRRTPCRIKCTILIVWVLAALISFPPLILMENDDDEQKCEVIEEEWYIYFSSTVSFFVPCAVMILVYVRIYLIAKKRTRDPPGEKQKKFGNLERKEGEAGEVERGEGREVSGLDVEEELSSSDGNDTVLCSRMKKRGIRTTKVAQVKLGESPLKPEVQHCVRVGRWKQRQRRERRFTFVLAVVMGVFVICWFPFFFTYTVFGPERVPKPLFEMFFWLGYCNSSLNPVIYTIFNNDFRRSFKKILCKTDRRQL